MRPPRSILTISTVAPPSPAPGSPVEQEVEEPDPPPGNHVKLLADAISKVSTESDSVDISLKVIPFLKTPSLVNQGVCPDTVYEGSDPVGLVNTTKLVSDRRRNGVAFIRYRLPLVFVDQKYDVPANMAEKIMVIWTEVSANTSHSRSEKERDSRVMRKSRELLMLYCSKRKHAKGVDKLLTGGEAIVQVQVNNPNGEF
ncbi:hypothetical protein GW17_00017616 [Ensete ventricosum]|nr:hypothetical protein GW17_00017616 [Ensete ventricosum]